MKFTLSLLKNFLHIDATINEIASKLTSIGLEVEEIIDRRDELKDFIVAEIIEAIPHPDAKSLQVCKVNDGNRIIQVICGAKNARSGIKVVLAPIGSRIPANNMVIKDTKIRGIESMGMLCSEKELLVGQDDNGIIEVKDSLKIGESFLSMYGLDDPVIDISITPNRGDCFGVYGIARDLAATGIGKLKDINIPEIQNDFKSDFKISIEEKKLCTAFTAYEIRNIQNQESPTWLRNILTNSGISSISFVVDVTNYISLCFAKPLHVYDKDKLFSDLTVKKSVQGKKFLALNDNEYILSDSDLIITSNDEICALAGIIGGKDSSCTMDTKNIIIESAMFDPIIIAKMGRKHSIVTDARQRFERGIDADFIKKGAILAVSMIHEYCKGDISQIISYESEKKDRLICFNYKTIEKISGIIIEKKIVEDILLKLGFKILENNLDALSVIVPSWRNDISIDEDIVEEILRIYGFNNLKEIPITKIFAPRILNFKQKISSSFKRIMATRNYDEVITWSFSHSKTIENFVDLIPSLYISNPISAELDYLRPTIIPNLIDLVDKAINRGFMSHGFFEVGPIFNGTEYSQELLHISGVKYGQVNMPPNFELRNIDIYDIKADISLLLANAGLSIDNIILEKGRLPKYYHPRRSSALKLGKNIIGYFGQIHPSIIKNYKIKMPICLFEISISELPESRLKYGYSSEFNDSCFQSCKRDFAFVMDKYIEASLITSFIKNIDKKLIESVEIFDIYQGDKIPSDKKSVAYKVVLRSSDRTLLEEEINDISQKIIDKVSEQFRVLLRI
jgi:phenylalanyl-tRNA synthetase beta chain